MFLETSSTTKVDVAVIGAGPAGLSIGAQCAGHGMQVCVVAPNATAAWPATYGAWSDEVEGLLPPSSVAHRWPTTVVDVGERKALPRGYTLLDGPGLQGWLSERAGQAGVSVRDGRVTALEQDARGARLVLQDGSELRATVVVDASGARSRWVARADGREPAAQTAYGVLAEASHPLAVDEMVMMDFSADFDDPLPSFLYAMPLPGGRLFAEETSLAARPPLPLEVLRARLELRLLRMGVRLERVLSVERCHIPMGIALPVRSQRTVAFGAAAGLIHPTTGYQLVRTLRAAPAVAAALAAGLNDGGPALAARRAYATLWPDARLRAWELYGFGLEALCRLDAPATRAFFRAFFALPEARWRPYLDGTASPAAICAAMALTFTRLPLGMRARLLAFSASAGTPPLLRALTPTNPS